MFYAHHFHLDILTPFRLLLVVLRRALSFIKVKAYSHLLLPPFIQKATFHFVSPSFFTVRIPTQADWYLKEIQTTLPKDCIWLKLCNGRDEYATYILFGVGRRKQVTERTFLT